jgi:hypothetical protein
VAVWVGISFVVLAPLFIPFLGVVLFIAACVIAPIAAIGAVVSTIAQKAWKPWAKVAAWCVAYGRWSLVASAFNLPQPRGA